MRPAVLKRSFMLGERLAKDGEAGAKEKHRSRARDGYTNLAYIMYQASNNKPHSAAPGGVFIGCAMSAPLRWASL